MHRSVEPKGWTALTSLNSVKRTEAMISKKPKRASFDEAMNEAFQVIFENLKEIEKEKQKKLRQKQDFEKRRGGTPSAVLSETSVHRTHYQERNLSTTVPTRPSSRKVESWIVHANNAHSTELAIITTPHDLASPPSTS